ncbi:MAG: acyltransferase [Desulfobacteraceae bacterium]|nr:MAG: acyltransferase [Desulfobacteraceae bacterium]
MIRDHRPYYLKRAYLAFETLYANWFLRPQLAHLGTDPTIFQPWNAVMFGGPIRIGNYANIICSSDYKVRLSIWSKEKNVPGITIGDYCLICPGVRISAADKIHIGDNCMLAAGVYITDADWHDIYDRTAAGASAPVILKDNVWVGDRATVCKGVTIGENSIVGAGSVVVSDVEPNTVVAGNPAKTIKHLDTQRGFIKRNDWFLNPSALNKEIDDLDRKMLQGNTFFGWLRSLVWPKPGD